MSGLLAALLAFGLLLAAQFVVWRIFRPAGHYLALALLYLVALGGSIAVFGVAGATPAIATWLVPGTLRDALNFLMLYTAATLAYMVTYSAVQADSPSMAILLQIDRAGAAGLRPEDMRATLDDGALVVPRLEDLVIGRLATVDRGHYVISGRGALLARLYIAYRALLRMEKGG